MTRTPKTKTEPFDQPSKLMQDTIALVNQIGVEDTFFKTKVPHGWLQKFVRGTFKNPSVNRVVYIYETLSGNKLLQS